MIVVDANILIQLEHAGAVRLMKAPGGVLATVDLVINELGPKLGDEEIGRASCRERV